jgi:hypothetical protein
MIAPAIGPSVWLGSEIDYHSDGLHLLSDADIAEIDAALAGLPEIDFSEIEPRNFSLPTLGSRLRAIGEALRHGRGFALLRGIPRDRYSTDEMARIYVGLGSYIGVPAPQSSLGELLGHVIDVSDIESEVRGYHAGGGQRFHTDTCDVVSLICLRAAKSGGLSRIASAAAVHNRMLQARPDLLETLYGSYVVRRMERDAELGSGRLVRQVAIFSRDSGALSCNISGIYPKRAVAFGDAAMTPLQIEALDELERHAASPEFYLDMSIGEGDIQFLNNRVILHGRTNYQDWPALTQRRHLMRLWLTVPSWPELPANQGMHGADDHAGWLRQRTPFMETPSRFLATMMRRKEAL